MYHFLETPAHDDERFDRQGPTPGRIAPGDDRIRDASASAVSKKGRVLLLEADPCFRAAISDCLLENGYQVVAVANAHQAFIEITADDFALVLYDPLMPGLTGESFYGSIRRIDPDLCGRFVFMCNDRTDAETNEFIKKINGFVLKKPFDVRDLLSSLTLAELQETFQSVFECASNDPADVLPAGGSQFPEDSVLQEKMCAILARAKTPSKPSVAPVDTGRERPLPHHQSSPGPSDAPLESEPPPRTGGISLSYALAALALLLALAGGLWLRYLNAQDRLDAVSSQRLGREAEWTAVSLDLQAALAIRAKAATAQSQLARIYAIRARPHWAPVLRCIVPPGDAKIEILEVSARGEKKDPGACEVRICGMALGSQPRLMADRYRQSVEQMLKRNANGRPVSTRLDQLEEASETLKEKRADFVMVVTIGSIEQAPAMSKEGR